MASAAGLYFTRAANPIDKPTAPPQTTISKEPEEQNVPKSIEKSDPGSVEEKHWTSAFVPLNDEESEEVAIIHEQIKKLNITGKIDSEKMDEFRGIVYKYQERILADAGRRILLDSPELARTKEGADTVVTLIDTLAYFGQNSADWPLAIEILRDIGTRPLSYSSTLSPEEKSTANITMQAFEQFARYKPEEAMEFILTSVDKEKRVPYISYLKTGLALAGFSKEDIYQRVSRLI
ncbi:hypothetical protein [Oligoflexus tunisiensis]|uniref:hypothetical protein n=1 Tax=Oligoflexus tunisiensis TaxID=708132 RepID=UPI001C4058A9|nr:hypothetical protein [Oligoflexus tunisiensis]